MIDRAAVTRAAPGRQGASAAALAQIEQALGVRLPEDYAELLRASDGIDGGDGLHVYAAAEVPKANTELDVAARLPGFLLFGDDSGDYGYFLDLSTQASPVYYGPRGTLRRADFETLAPDLESWVLCGLPSSPPGPAADPRLRPVDVLIIAMPAGGPQGLLAIKNALRLNEPIDKLLRAARTPPVRLVSGEQLGWCAEQVCELNKTGRCLQITEHDDPARVIDENAAT
jgi:hypothetical protein